MTPTALPPGPERRTVVDPCASPTPTPTADNGSGAGVPTTTVVVTATTVDLGADLPATGVDPSATSMLGIGALLIGFALLAVAGVSRLRTKTR